VKQARGQQEEGGWANSSTVKMEEVCSSETFIESDRTARLYIPDESASNPTNNSSYIFYITISTIVFAK
jgi:hypothetical protein